MRDFSSLYHIKGNAVWFEGIRCLGANVQDFKNLGYGWATSAGKVYHWGGIRKEIDAHSVELLNAIYAQDVHGIHHYMKTLEVNEPTDFRVLDSGFYSRFDDWGSDLTMGGYACDNKNVWWHHRTIRGADPKTIQSLRNGYAIDATSVYKNEKRIPKADPATFIPYSRDLALDKNHVYFAGNIIPNISPNSVHKMLFDGAIYDGEKQVIMGPLQSISHEEYLMRLDGHIKHLQEMRELIATKHHEAERWQRYSKFQFIPLS